MADITYSAGNSPTAAEMNSYGLHTGGAWNSFTPTATQTGSAPLTINRASYFRAGRFISASVCATVSSGTSTVGNSVILITLPVTAASMPAVTPIGTGVISDVSVPVYYPCIAVWYSTTEVAFLTTASTTALYAGQTGSSMNAQLNVNDTIRYEVTYEAASG